MSYSLLNISDSVVATEITKITKNSLVDKKTVTL